MSEKYLMEMNKKYKVVKPSKNGEFLVGDIVSLDKYGGISNPIARGSIRKEDIISATKGWKIIEIENYDKCIELLENIKKNILKGNSHIEHLLNEFIITYYSNDDSIKNLRSSENFFSSVCGEKIASRFKKLKNLKEELDRLID